MDPVDRLNQCTRQGRVEGMLLSSVPHGRVVSAYGDSIARSAPHQPTEVVDAAVTASFLDRVDMHRHAYGYPDAYANQVQVENIFHQFLISTYEWTRGLRHPQQIRFDELNNVRIHSLTGDPSVDVSGRLQHVFRVRNTFRGVAAVGRGPLGPLVGRCLIGLEIISSIAEYDGPFFAVAFNGKTWCTIERPAGYERGAAGLQIQRREANVDLDDPQQRDAFIVNLRHAFMTAIEAEY